MMIMTPIAPHTMNTRSIILSGEEAVTVEIGEGRHNTIEKAVASFDGDTQISMVTGDRISHPESHSQDKDPQAEPSEFCGGSETENEQQLMQEVQF